jgi:hypothetical protein
MEKFADDFESGSTGLRQSQVAKELGWPHDTRLKSKFYKENFPVWTQLTEPVPGSQGFRRIKEAPISGKKKNRRKK